MCNLSLACQVWDGSCDCPSVEHCVYQPIPVPFVPQTDPSILMTLFKIIKDQGETIKRLAEQTKSGLDRISLLEKEIEAKDSLSVPEENLTPLKMIEILYGPNPLFEYTLNLLSEVPSPAYKERAFSILFQVADLQGKPVTCEKKLNFKAELYNTENPPKLVKFNTAGEQIMRGTMEVESTGTVLFRKIILKEVSSHFSKGCFYLVISCKDSNHIRPFVIENLVVKARKMKAEKKKEEKEKGEDEEEKVEKKLKVEANES